MGAALAALALVAPWLVWLPFVRAPAAVELLGAIAIAGAWHGWGRVVARVSRRDGDAVVTTAWGLAATCAIAGVAIALHVYDARLLVIGGAVAHTADLALRWREVRELRVRPTRYSIVPVAIVVVIALFAVLAAAGQGAARPFDDDGSVIAQIQRLVDTGALGDAIGYPRTAQLGGHVALAGLASAFAEPARARLVDGGLGLALVLALACTRIRPRDTCGAIWLVLIALAACVLAPPGSDLAPLWLPAALIVAADATLAGNEVHGARALVPVALLAGALAAIRSELAPAALALIVGAWWLARTRTREDLPRAFAAIGGMVLVLAPYAVARTLAWHAVASSAHALVEPPHGSPLVRLAVCAAIAFAAAPLALLVVRELPDRRLRIVAVACAVGVASVTAFGVRPYASHVYWPLAVGGLVAVAIALAARREPPAIALVLSLLALVFVHQAQAATGRYTSWSWRAYDLGFDVEAARHALPEGGSYERLLAPVPRDAIVAVWVTRPELLDYAANRIVDLRTPRVAKLRDPDRFAELVSASHARWLLLEDDVPRGLDALAERGRVAANGPRVRLIAMP
ncbi:MAG: hypothetical protein ACM31C_20470 [Acidobacteriota bacterium]